MGIVRTSGVEPAIIFVRALMFFFLALDFALAAAEEYALALSVRTHAAVRIRLRACDCMRLCCTNGVAGASHAAVYVALCAGVCGTFTLALAVILMLPFAIAFVLCVRLWWVLRRVGFATLRRL